MLTRSGSDPFVMPELLWHHRASLGAQTTIGDLPQEIFEQIVTLMDKKKALICAAVCRSRRSVARPYPFLSMHFLSIERLLSFIKHLEAHGEIGKLTRIVTIEGVHEMRGFDVSYGTIVRLARRLPRLQELRLARAVIMEAHPLSYFWDEAHPTGSALLDSAN